MRYTSECVHLTFSIPEDGTIAGTKFIPNERGIQMFWPIYYLDKALHKLGYGRPEPGHGIRYWICAYAEDKLTVIAILHYGRFKYDHDCFWCRRYYGKDDNE